VLPGVGDRHPHLGGDEARRVLGARLERGGQPLQRVRALAGRSAGPGAVVERPPGGADGLVNIHADGRRNGPDDFFCGWIDDGDHVRRC